MLHDEAPTVYFQFLYMQLGPHWPFYLLVGSSVYSYGLVACNAALAVWMGQKQFNFAQD